MIASDLRCGVIVYDRRRVQFRTCGAKAPFVLIVGGDELFAMCQRHDGRIDRAFPGATQRSGPRPAVQTDRKET